MKTAEELKKDIEEMYAFYRNIYEKEETTEYGQGGLEATCTIYLQLYGGKELYKLMFGNKNE